MSQELTKIQLCIVMRNGIEIWIEEERAKRLQQALKELSVNKFIDFGERSINTADILGVFTANDIEEYSRKKSGQWKCQKRAVWHDKGEKCECVEKVNYGKVIQT